MSEPDKRDEGTLLSTADVAYVLNLSRRRVLQLVEEGKLVPTMRSPIGNLFSPATVERFADERKRGIR